MHSLKDYHYDLPEDLIALKPAAQRDRSRLLAVSRAQKTFSHREFYEIPDFLSPGDVLVINDTRVIRARLMGKKETGGKVEALIVNYPEAVRTAFQSGDLTFQCMVKASKKPGVGTWIFFENGLKARVEKHGENGVCDLVFPGAADLETIERAGRVPLPPYIESRREKDDGVDHPSAYQTIYASKKGAVAAPTAGLHFSTDIFKRLNSRGVKIAPVTLHVGHGTFLPVRARDIRKHRMHPEWSHIPDASADVINHARENGGRIVSVGTTCVRTLEHAAGADGKIRPGSAKCDLFIYPGHRFKAVDALVTNFHLPESTLLMLVSAFAGRDLILSAYQAAIDERYRFYSYGDAMYIE
ncbi:S-adenosylmethionine:tRNA ribosyltransferase-isomerase [Candidatus Desulfarcum epimagneticum]|uniref:S-adenosylmethionine:tRNA ribosyltransferase-isomerase n=1 Tax=uncultured Desulfobacteraceae bacterium TaxID=218296 RepID=A0A484HN92_9BACT|nr:S-adenosylmethionine:tRNA ribosyltransferase-isomerase [uncultured Desulfobacteraceae bacterium]